MRLRRSRFADVVERQLDLFEREHRGLIDDCVEAERAYDRAERDEAEERYGDYVDLVETGTEPWPAASAASRSRSKTTEARGRRPHRRPADRFAVPGLVSVGTTPYDEVGRQLSEEDNSCASASRWRSGSRF